MPRFRAGLCELLLLCSPVALRLPYELCFLDRLDSNQAVKTLGHEPLAHYVKRNRTHRREDLQHAFGVRHDSAFKRTTCSA